ncbi:c-type cytochrome [Novosphingobium guangzhouense]|uniref:Cytochrome C n=1 Tax=Novosphingobium guangzhouense TaxID=1850347 RepID=A0A2K2FZE2_9SPHN|nr:c-type cytochrome [Novosphingobium guangzhouense]PNU04128.1 cytochrome C [Novosphingobium guangzhouense]
MKQIAIIGVFALTATLAGCGDKAPEQTSAASANGSAALPGAAATTDAVTDPAPMAFATCRSCHSTQAGQNGIGPTLHGVVGSKAGAVEGFAFSPALKNSGITWDRQSLDTWLQGPMKMVPGTRMVLPVPDAQKRKAIIDYLETLK